MESAVSRGLGGFWHRAPWTPWPLTPPRPTNLPATTPDGESTAATAPVQPAGIHPASEPTIFERSRPGRRSSRLVHHVDVDAALAGVPAALSGVEVERLFTVARRLRDEGRALVFISHRFDEVFALCDTVTVMRDGSYIDTLSIADTDVDTLVALMVGREVGDLFGAAEAKEVRVVDVQPAVVFVDQDEAAALHGLLDAQAPADALGEAGLAGA